MVTPAPSNGSNGSTISQMLLQSTGSPAKPPASGEGWKSQPIFNFGDEMGDINNKDIGIPKEGDKSVTHNLDFEKKQAADPNIKGPAHDAAVHNAQVDQVILQGDNYKNADTNHDGTTSAQELATEGEKDLKAQKEQNLKNLGGDQGLIKKDDLDKTISDKQKSESAGDQAADVDLQSDLDLQKRFDNIDAKGAGGATKNDGVINEDEASGKAGLNDPPPTADMLAKSNEKM